MAGAAAVLVDQGLIGKCCLRIFVQALHVGVRGSAVEIEILLLDIFAVVALVTAEAEEALLEDRVAGVPEAESEADALVAVADAGEAVLVPAVGADCGVLEREVIPSLALRRVVFAYGTPSAFGEIGSPAVPVRPAQTGILNPRLFGVHGGLDNHQAVVGTIELDGLVDVINKTGTMFSKEGKYRVEALL